MLGWLAGFGWRWSGRCGGGEYVPDFLVESAELEGCAGEAGGCGEDEGAAGTE